MSLNLTPMSANKPRIIILANKDKPLVREALRDLRPWFEARGTVVAEPDIHDLTFEQANDLPSADLLVVLGGDGTILSLARRLAHLGLPVMGVNFGKLGFLAEFNPDDLDKYWEDVAEMRCRQIDRLMVHVCVFPPDGTRWVDCDKPDPPARFESLAMNDAVITAGPPFRMIEVDLGIDPALDMGKGTVFSGDGVIIATASGSTAYNLAAGGPIVSPGAEALVVTPICPHSLAFRPIVVNSQCCVQLVVNQANEGTTLVIDGQESVKLNAGDRIVIREHEHRLKLLRNPGLSYWSLLAKKLHWAARPSST